MCSTQVPEFRVGYDISTDKLDALYQKLKPKVGLLLPEVYHIQ
jgi:hypothetical protein